MREAANIKKANNNWSPGSTDNPDYIFVLYLKIKYAFLCSFFTQARVCRTKKWA